MKIVVQFLLFCLLYTYSEGATLTWNDNSDNEDGFKIERSTDGVNFTEIATVGVDVNTYIDNPVGGQVYSYRVKAYNEYGDSGYSNVAVLDATLPTPPEDLERVLNLTPPIIEEYWIEAENSETVLIPPMAQGDDPTASGGKYLYTPEGSGLNTDTSSSIYSSYSVNIIKAGTYKIWGRVISPDGGSDSFYVQIDQNTPHTWDLGVRTSWEWVQLQDRTDPSSVGSGEPITTAFSAGLHTLKIIYREDGTKLDRIFITENLNATP